LLVVDDEEGPRQALRVIFSGDYDVLTASDGYTAIEIAQTRAVDVAVLDIRMANMSGIEVLERLQFVDPTIGVVMMTAYETTETLRQAMRLSATDYITKPFDIAVMRAAVQRALDRRSVRRQARTSAEQLAELQDALQKTRVDEELLRSRNDLYASVLHDINGPLTIISGLTQLINQRVANAESLEGENLVSVKDHLQRISRQAMICTDIQRRYLNRLRAAHDKQWVSVNEIFEDVHELLRFHPSIKGNELKVSGMSPDANAAIGGTDLIQILLNLSVNALQAVPQAHRVTIYAHVLEKPLEVGTLKEAPTDRYVNLDGFKNETPLVSISIEDDGPGIPPPILTKLFQPYFTTKPRGQGTGLGLCIVQRLVAEAGGLLHLHSVQGTGTTFNLYLPGHVASAH